MENDPAPPNRQGVSTAAMTGLLLAVARHEDKAAFAELFDFYAPRIKSYLRRLRAADEAIDDLVQEVMVTVWRKAQLFDPERASAGTWIFTIARNRYIDLVRRQKRPELDAHDPMLTPEPALAADETLVQAQTVVRVRAALKTLPPDQAEVVTKSFLEGKTHSAIADELALPLGTVKSRLRLAFARLRSALEEHR